MNIVFMGTPEFAVPCLAALLDNGYNPGLVVTQPDKPRGRGQRMSIPPVKEYALGRSIKVLQPEKIKNNEEFLAELAGYAPDLAVVVAYGKILPPSVLEIPKFGCINVHASLLPKYRGAAPIQWAVINGEKKTGITTMLMDEGMDTGDMILREELPIGDDETAGALHDRLSLLGAETLIKTLKLIESGFFPREKQDSSQATYAPMIDKGLGEVNWRDDADKIRNLIRGLTPWPGAYTFLNGERIKLWTARLAEGTGSEAGVVKNIDKEGLLVGTGKGYIRISELQPESGRRMTADEYVRGHDIKIGQILGKN